MASTAKRERAEAMLGELAELGLMLARELAVQARAAETPEDQVALAAAFQKTARAVRLTLALDLKLERDAARLAREDQQIADERAARAAKAEAPVEPARIPPTPEDRQKRRVRRLLDRLLWNEAEGDEDEYGILREDLDARLDEAAQAEGFADLSVEVLTQRLKADMQIGGRLVFTDAATFEALAAQVRKPQPADTG